MFIRTMIILSLTILLSSGSFILDDYLNDQVKYGQPNEAQLAFARKKQLVSVYRHDIEHQQVGNSLWQTAMLQLAKNDGEIAFELANYFQADGDEATFEFWLNQAAQKNSSKAKIVLAQRYYDQGKITLAAKLLASSALTEKQLTLQTKIAMLQGNTEALLTLQQAFLNNFKASQFFKELKTFHVFDVADNTRQHVLAELSELEINESRGEKCRNSMQLFATNYQQLKAAENLIKQVQQHPINEFFCFDNPRYIPAKALNCSQDEQIAITCDEELWQQYTNNLDSRYLALLLPVGGANVHLGILYLDAQDTHAVFIHELSHLLGFIDEYPLASTHKACANKSLVSFSNNIAVLDPHLQENGPIDRKTLLAQIPWAEKIKKSTPIMKLQDGTMVIGTSDDYKNEIGLFKISTCDQQGLQAYKPLAKRTALQNFEASFPQEYLAIYRDSYHQFSMPSFHYNIALALIQNEEQEKAKLWIKRALLQELDQKRKARIWAGDF